MKEGEAGRERNSEVNNVISPLGYLPSLIKLPQRHNMLGVPAFPQEPGKKLICSKPVWQERSSSMDCYGNRGRSWPWSSCLI